MTIRGSIFRFVPLKRTIFAYKEPRYAPRSCLEKRSERVVKAIYRTLKKKKEKEC